MQIAERIDDAKSHTALWLVVGSLLAAGCNGPTNSPNRPGGAESDTGASASTDASDDPDGPPDSGLEPDTSSRQDAGNRRCPEPKPPPKQTDYQGVPTAGPEVPATSRNLAPIEDQQFTEPQVPPVRTTYDERIGVNLKRNIGGEHSLYLMTPEALDVPLLESKEGLRMTVAPKQGGHIDESKLYDRQAIDASVGTNHLTICDPTTDFPGEHGLDRGSMNGPSGNPSPCPNHPDSDCYDLTVLLSVMYENETQMQFWGTPLKVRVDDPKTPDASIADVQYGTPVPGPKFRAKRIFEPTVTGDGRLLVTRIANTNLSCKDPDTGTARDGKYDVVYSVYPESESPCDVRKWDEFHPISHAPHDPDMKGRYGIAKYPLRDPQGETIPDGAEMGGTYPWIDRDGDNLFFTSYGRTVSYWDGQSGAVKHRYPVECAHGASNCELPTERDEVEGGGRTRGITVAGLWTHGKMVVIDSILNHTDFKMGVENAEHRSIELYEGKSGDWTDEGAVHVSAGRSTSTRNFPSGSSANTTFFTSLEDRFNHLPEARPKTVRDVVWTVQTGHRTAEFTFDDYVNPDAFILSSMAGAVGYDKRTSRLRYYDGFQRGGAPAGVRVQNASTALSRRWNVPSHGRVKGGGRIEPVAAGGIRGKGFWSSGDNEIAYDISKQPTDPESRSWFVGIFVDPRFSDDGRRRRLLTFPDGSRIELAGRTSIELTPVGSQNRSRDRHRVSLERPIPHHRFTHLGFGISYTSEGTSVEFYLNGMRYSEVEFPETYFQFEPGTFSVGAADADHAMGAGAFRGWIDDLKVFAEAPGPELACNYARGTLAAVETCDARDWVWRAHRYPEASHRAIRRALDGDASRSKQQFVCYRDYSTNQPNLRQLPDGLRSVRKELIFPEAPREFGKPRPDSSDNQFCQSCHVSSQSPPLSMDALEFRPNSKLEDDSRRQPMQPPRLMFGNVPKGYMGPNRPSNRVRGRSGGYLLDRIVFPAN